MITGVGSGSYAGDLTPPTINVGDIDPPMSVLTPLLPSHANCMQHVLRYWELMVQNARKLFGGRGSAPDPAGGAYSAPQAPSWWGEWLADPSPRTPLPALGPSGLASPLLSPTPKLVQTPLT